MLKKINLFKNLRMHSSTFYLASLWLPAEVRIKVAKLYFFCRYLDDLADKPGSKNQDTIECILQDVQHTTNHNPISTKIHSLIEEYQIPNSVPLALINGIKKDFNNIEIESQKALLNYAYEVAGTVGIMMAHLLGVKSKCAQHHAIDLSIAMQLTNIARDVYEDALLNRRYLPGNWTDEISPNVILNPSPSETIKINKGIIKVIELSKIYYDSGIAGITFLPKEYKPAIIRAAYLYRAIGETILAVNKPFQNTKIKVNKIKKAKILLNHHAYIDQYTNHSIELHKDINHLPFTNHA